jgi:tRNA A-37 threonylcarbamoyl transferase component Bud32
MTSPDVAATLQSLTAAVASRYRVERVLGSGGMATVYLAEDVRHGRRVAMKVLHPELAAAVGADRFLNEVKTIATLQHPHIVGLIDSGDANGALYYVMPYVEGESLRDRLERERQLPIEGAVRIARDVAAALDYAHRHGVVHRDIKPENILLHDGNALVADFGIALAVGGADGQRLTQTGVSIGTPQYMAPEQALGERTIDARADVYALGVVAYEMLSGEQPFTGSTMQAIVGRAMTERPRPITAERPAVPRWLEAAVLRAMEKLPADRFSTAADFARALETPITSGDFVSASRHRTTRSLTWIAGGVAMLAIGVGAGWALARARDTGAEPRASRLLLNNATLAGSGQIALQRLIAITPDGSTVLYVARGADGFGQMVKQALADSAPAVIPGVRRWIATPMVSADGKSFVGMAGGERLAYRYPIEGGPGEPLTLVGGYTDFSYWDDTGTLWYSPSNGGGIMRQPRGDSAQFVAHSEALRLEQVLPDRHHILVMRQATTQTGLAAIFDAVTGEIAPLLPAALQEIRYAAGYLIYVLPNGVLQAVPFDIDARRVTGAAVTLASKVSVTGAGVAQMAVAHDGTIAFIVEELPELVLVGRDGSARPALDAHHNYHAPRFSPDGRHLAFDFNTESGRDVWVISRDNGTLSRATFDGNGHDVTWTPDARKISYISARNGTEQIFLKSWNGSEAPEALFASANVGYTGLWLPDQSALVSVVNDLRPHSGADIVLLGNGGRGPAQPLVASDFTESYPALSADGKWLAYVSDQSGHLEVYVRAMDAAGGETQISASGGTEPAWSADGRSIFYRTIGDADPKLVEATVRGGKPMVVTARRTLFSVVDMIPSQPHVGYDISPDGSVFAMVRRTPAQHIMVLQNIRDLMRR